MEAYLYILRLKSGSLYIGCTKNIQKRYQEHLSGNACRSTKLDPPIGLVHTETFDGFSEARKREAQIKRWSRAKKEALIAGDFDQLKLLSKSKRSKR